MMETNGFLKYPRLLITAFFAVVLIVLFFTGQLVTIVRPGGANAQDSFPSSGLDFNAAAYVKRIWPLQVVPAAKNNSVALTVFLDDYAKDPAAALKTYGHFVSGSNNVLVKFSGVVQGDDTSSPIGTMQVNVTDGTKTIPVQVDIGPVILGTSLRDSLKFISFEEFLNQIQYGNVADQLNKTVVSQVVSSLNIDSLKGKTITVYGAYTLDSTTPDNISVTPVIIAEGTAG